MGTKGSANTGMVDNVSSFYRYLDDKPTPDSRVGDLYWTVIDIELENHPMQEPEAINQERRPVLTKTIQASFVRRGLYKK